MNYIYTFVYTYIYIHFMPTQLYEKYIDRVHFYGLLSA